MKSLRTWTQVGLLLAISTWTAFNPVRSEDSQSPLEPDRPAAVTPDVVSEDDSDPASKTESKSEPKVAAEALSPEPDSSLPTTTVTPPTGESSVPKPLTPMDIDSQFETPIEVNPLPTNAGPRPTFSGPSTTKVQAPVSEVPKLPQPTPAVAAPVDPLVKLATEAVEVCSRRYLTTDMHTPWQIIHGLLAYRQDFQLKLKDSDKKINAIEWASSGVNFRGESLFQKTPYGGRAHPYSQIYYFEGHPTQFMAYLTMSRLPSTHEFKTDSGEVVTVQDIINNAKMEVTRSPEVEMTWTLWALAHYLEPTAQWVNKSGEPWSMEELLRVELRNSQFVRDRVRSERALAVETTATRRVARSRSEDSTLHRRGQSPAELRWQFFEVLFQGPRFEQRLQYADHRVRSHGRMADGRSASVTAVGALGSKWGSLCGPGFDRQSPSERRLRPAVSRRRWLADFPRANADRRSCGTTNAVRREWLDGGSECPMAAAEITRQRRTARELEPDDHRSSTELRRTAVGRHFATGN